MRLEEYRTGDTIPDGAKLVSTRYKRGRLIDVWVEYRWMGWLERTHYKYEPVPVFTYEVPESEQGREVGET